MQHGFAQLIVEKSELASPSMCVIGAWFVLITQLDLYLYEYTHW